MMEEFNIYDILFVNKKEITSGSHVQGKKRPAIVIQNDDGNKYAPTLVVMDLTSKIKKTNQPTHWIVKANKNNGLKCDSMILGESIYTIDKRDVITKWGSLDNEQDQIMATKCFLSTHFGNKKIKVEVLE